MEVREYVDALRDEGSAMADSARDHLGIPIPCCPGWDMLELVEHTGEMHHAVNELIRRRTMDPDDIDDPAPPPSGVVPWFEDGIEALASTFLEVDPSLPVWSWAPQRSVAFWQRRIALETAIHRWDAQSAIMDPAPIDAALAADGVDEFFTLYMLRAMVPTSAGPARSSASTAPTPTTSGACGSAPAAPTLLGTTGAAWPRCTPPPATCCSCCGGACTRPTF